jgi:hypothetical protein
LSKLKPRLVERYEDWIAQFGVEAAQEVPPYLPGDPSTDGDLMRQMDNLRVEEQSDPRMLQQQRSNDDMRRREEEILRNREEELRRQQMDSRRRQEQDGIIRRQQEADAAARAARNVPASYTRARSPPPISQSVPVSHQRARSPPPSEYHHYQSEAPSSYPRSRSPGPAVTAAQQTAADYRRRQEVAEVAVRAARQAAGYPSRTDAPTPVSIPQYDDGWRRQPDANTPRRLPEPNTAPLRSRQVGAAASMPNMSDPVPTPMMPDGTRYLMPLENPSHFEEPSDSERESIPHPHIHYPQVEHRRPQGRRCASLAFSYPPPELDGVC